MIRIYEGKIKIDTESTTLLFGLGDESISLLYYGPRLKEGSDFDLLNDGKRRWHPSVDDVNNHKLQCLGSFGDGDNRDPSVMLINGLGSCTNRFSLAEASVSKGGPSPAGLPTAHGAEQTLVLRFINQTKDAEYKIFYTTFASGDIIAVCASMKNIGEKPISVKRLMSNQLELWGNSCSVASYDGVWGKERQKHVQKLEAGALVFDSKNGSSSNKHNPYFSVATKEGWYGFNLVYSGNFRNAVELEPVGIIRILSGINDYFLDISLERGKKFDVPQSVMAYARTEAELSEQMRRFVSDCIIPERFKSFERPICINTWEAFYMNFTPEKLLKLARCSSELGIELFVLDDGWFAGRDDDSKGLGDWQDDENKTGGLAELSRKIKALGMKFGIWMEPENANFDSELVRTHPEFVLALPGIPPMQRRRTVSLDLTNDECGEFLYRKIKAVIELCRPDYIKWDYNRTLIDVCSSVSYGEYALSYIKGLYRLLGRLTSEYPEILFESCSSGGNRYDLGLLCYMPQVWTSDDTDARERVTIQRGTLEAYPKSTMCAHVSASPNHQTGKKNSLFSRFASAMSGVLGYELDVCALTETEKSEIKEQISFYKKYRKCLQFGDYYDISEKCPQGIKGWIHVSEDKNLAVLCLIKTEAFINTVRGRAGLTGLDPEKTYELHIKDKKLTAKGDLLNSFGLDIVGYFDDKGNTDNGISAVTAEIKRI